ncbi:MAG TPA: hypothetical protein VGK78_12635 [Nocardioides sp.]|uniref:hypothetical protein n=1 Tax=Nocardioides sp. TaxID=35761 RepID=UPI002F40D9AB
MALTIHQSRPELVDTGRRDPPDAPSSEGADDEVRADTCPCEACQGPARDEMWSRWA